MISKLFFPLSIIILLSSCHKDIEEEKDLGPNTPNPTLLAEIESKLIGYVYDENNQPVAGADVLIYSGSTTTDEYGVFVFEDQKLDPNGTFIKATKDDYIFGSDLIFPKSGPSVSYILMMNDDGAYNFESSSGGEVNISEGGKIIFPASAISTSSGQAYSGNVNVTAKYLDPNDPNLDDKMPGGLRGIDSEDLDRVLGTLGMMAVELKDDSGNELKISNGSKATLHFPAPTGINNLPSEIALWSFDEVKGLWIEEGLALLSGGNYIAEVGHFSFWNCDAPFPLVHVCGSVLFSDGSPASSYNVKVFTEGIGTGSGRVDLDGNFCGKMPKSEDLTIKIINPVCGKVVYQSAIGPFEEDTELSPITIDKNTFSVTGTVMCIDQPLSSASVVLKINEKTIITETAEDGTFEINLDNEICDNVTSFGIFAIDNVTNESSALQTVNANEASGLILNVCSNCEFAVEINSTIPDVCDQRNISLSAEVSPNGNYSYSWSNGSSESSTNVESSDLYCVTVTNTDEGCEKIICEEISVNQNLADSIFVFYTDCNVGNIEIGVFGGVPPYSYNTSGPDGYSSTASLLEGLAVGTYSINVTDSEGCELSTSQVVQESDPLGVELVSSGFCSETFIEVSGENSTGGRFSTYEWSTGETTSFISVFTDGQYCVTVTDQKGCTAESCIDVVVEVFDLGITLTSCNDNIYTFEGLNPDFFINIFSNNGNTYEYSDVSSFDYNVLVDGYSFSYYAFTPNTQCGIEDFYELPQFEGLSVGTITNTTCGTCTDGAVELIIDNGATCKDCIFGELRLFLTNDLTTNLIDQNNSMTLGAGEYYAVVVDQNTGCYIASELIKIE